MKKIGTNFHVEIFGQKISWSTIKISVILNYQGEADQNQNLKNNFNILTAENYEKKTIKVVRDSHTKMIKTMRSFHQLEMQELRNIQVSQTSMTSQTSQTSQMSQTSQTSQTIIVRTN